MVPIAKRCSIINCDALVVANELCAKHYKRVQRHGDAEHRKNAEASVAMGAEKHPLYSVWRNITRVSSGTQVCERWKKFSTFVADVVAKPAGAFRFERIERTGVFSPENSVWSELKSSPEDRKYQAGLMRKYRDANPRYFWNADLKKNYGVTAEWYDAQLEKQNGVCAICGLPERTKIRGALVRLAVDHCHHSKQVRGLLCTACNRAIGLLNHDTKLLQSAIQYLSINP
jgi:hypothetical protein